MYLCLFLFPCSLVPLSSESINAPVATRSIMRIKVVQIPPQTPEDILTWLEKHVHLISEALVQVVDVLLHIPRAVASRNDGAFGFEKEGERFLPFVHGRGITESGMEDDEAVEVRIVGVEMSGFM